MLTSFGPDIWIAEGPTLKAGLGFRYPTRMAIIRLADGGLFVWSPTAPDPALVADVERLGPVSVLVAPNSLHDSFIGAWKSAFPAARMLAAPGLRKRRTDLSWDGELDDAPQAEWSRDIDHVVMGGNAITTEIVFFHRASGTVLFTDLLQQFPEGWFSGWQALVARLDLMIGREPQVPRKFRVAFTDKRAARMALRRILAWPAERVLMAHGTPVTRDAKALLARGFSWLAR
jgi:hypothetical protein